ncbi:MAG: hypothetical protein JWP06_850 [Candidatus Saccharibacteria bacterium]|nr:hypothetical protein [Candidatus Saccharibacteria bacterium]
MRKTKTILSGTERGFFQGCLLIISCFVLILNYLFLQTGELLSLAIVDIVYGLALWAYISLLQGKNKSEVLKYSLAF